MKKIIITLTISLITYFASAQIKKGQFLVGGNATFSSNENGGQKTSQFNISPNAGYFFMNKLAGGLKLNLGYGKSDMFGVKNTATNYGISPFVRYYILPASNKVNVFAEASYGWGKSKDKSRDFTARSTYNGYSFLIGPTFFITPNIAIEITGGYSGNQYKDKSGDISVPGKSKERLFQAGVGFQIHL